MNQAHDLFLTAAFSHVTSQKNKNMALEKSSTPPLGCKHLGTGHSLLSITTLGTKLPAQILWEQIQTMVKDEGRSIHLCVENRSVKQNIIQC